MLIRWVNENDLPAWYALVGGFPGQGFIIKNAGLLPSQEIMIKGVPATYHMEYIEWLARCGVVAHIPAVQEAVDEIMLAFDDTGVCRIPVHDDVFKAWGPYGGQQLEVDWKAKKRRDCDITFRALLIVYYSGYVKERA